MRCSKASQILVGLVLWLKACRRVQEDARAAFRKRKGRRRGQAPAPLFPRLRDARKIRNHQALDSNIAHRTSDFEFFSKLLEQFSPSASSNVLPFVT